MKEQVRADGEKKSFISGNQMFYSIWLSHPPTFKHTHTPGILSKSSDPHTVKGECWSMIFKKTTTKKQSNYITGLIICMGFAKFTIKYIFRPEALNRPHYIHILLLHANYI